MTTITKLHLNGSDYDIGFNPSNAGTTWQVLTKTAAWYEWDNAAWSDYSRVTKTISWWTVELWLRTIVDTPTWNFTLTAPATLKTEKNML
jgi:hypothetical protein